MDERPTFAGGRNIAVKVPPHQWQQTVAFYRDVLGLAEVDDPATSGPRSVGFAFGANRLWIDRVPTVSQAELWLQVTTDDTAAAARHLAAHAVTRCDEIEPLDSTSAFWITGPAAVVHLVSPPD
jgi:catechol 2,3-dioxygenase-like lactoylglutathione lyase family enzyme